MEKILKKEDNKPRNRNNINNNDNKEKSDQKTIELEEYKETEKNL